MCKEEILMIPEMAGKPFLCYHAAESFGEAIQHARDVPKGDLVGIVPVQIHGLFKKKIKFCVVYYRMI